MKVLSKIFYAFLGAFGYLPTSKWGIIAAVLNIFSLCFNCVYFLSFNQSVGSYKKSYVLFGMLVMLTSTFSNLLVHLELLAKRQKLLEVKVSMEGLLTRTPRSSILKYFFLISVVVSGSLVFLTKSQVSPLVILLTFSWIFSWNLKLVAFLSCVDRVQKKLKLVSCELKRSPSNEKTLELLESYIEVHRVVGKLMDLLRLSLPALVMQFLIFMLNILYWGALGLFKDMRFISELQCGSYTVAQGIILVFVFKSCDNCWKLSKELSFRLHDIQLRDRFSPLVQQFIAIVDQHPIVFSVGDFFAIKMRNLGAMFIQLVTYLVIMISFDNSTDMDVRNLKNWWSNSTA